MSAGLEHYSKDELIAELINRQTFVGLVVFHRSDAKDGHVEPGEVVMTKSPPLTREGVVKLLEIGQALAPGMFTSELPPATSGLTLRPDALPLRHAEGGDVRIGSTRINLDLIVECYENGMTPEEMVTAYDSLDLADVYAAIWYYLRHRKEVGDYMQRREAEIAALRQAIEARQPPLSRDDLMARYRARKEANATNRN